MPTSDFDPNKDLLWSADDTEAVLEELKAGIFRSALEASAPPPPAKLAVALGWYAFIGATLGFVAFIWLVIGAIL